MLEPKEGKDKIMPIWSEQRAQKALRDMEKAARIVNYIASNLVPLDTKKGEAMNRIQENAQLILKDIKVLKTPKRGLKYAM